MNRIKTLVQNVKENKVDYYTFLVLAVGIPLVVASMFGWQIGLLLSFVIQAIVGILNIRSSL